MLLQLVNHVADISLIDDVYTVNSSAGVVIVCLDDCSCVFRKSMMLPCRHIFSLRQKHQKPLFDPTLCDRRWTYDYYKSTQRVFIDSCQSESPTHSQVTFSSSRSKRPLSQNQKFKKAVVLTSELASLASEASNVHFSRRIKLLNQLVEHWKKSEEVALVEIDEGKLRSFVR